MLNSACATDVNHIRNMELSDIIGQPQVISVLELNLQAFQNLRMSSPGSKPQFGPGLCSGPSGTGKTVTVKAAHNAIGNSKFIAVNGVTLGKKGEFFSVMMNADDDTTVFIDEAQAIDKKTQQLLLTAISERKLDVPVGDFNAERFTISLANFTLFLATTDEHCLIGPLRNRMRFNCRFDYYQIADLIEIIRRRADALRWQYESGEVLELIAARAKGTPRLAIESNLHHARSQAVRNRRDVITVQDVHEAFRILQIDEAGLDQADRSYLDILHQYGPSPLNLISSRLSKPESTVSRVLEPYLIRNDFVLKDRHSLRMITSKGKAHLERTNRPILK